MTNTQDHNNRAMEIVSKLKVPALVVTAVATAMVGLFETYREEKKKDV